MKKDEEFVVVALTLGAVAYLVWMAFNPTDSGGATDSSNPSGGSLAANIVAALSSGATDSSNPSGGSLAANIVAALSSFENVAASHNNPGGLCGGYDANGQCTGPATFATLQIGEAKAEALVTKFLTANPLITLQDFVKKWSGGSGDVLDNYVSHVEDNLGLDGSDPIANADGSDDANSGDDDEDDE